MYAISSLTQSFSRRTRFGLPLVARLTDFDRRKSIMNNTRQSASFHFASSEYEKCFRDLPKPNVPFLKASSIEFLDAFDKTSWYEDPISSLLNGKELRGGHSIETVNALGETNGRQEYATKDQIQALKDHISTFQSNENDLRESLRRIEQKLLTEHAGFLIGNQCIDFQKQDGVTEMEEAVMANHVERALNDLVLRDEADGKIEVNRKPIYVSAVSNFTNFLDLFRKTIRNLELGIPCVVLGRSNTAQHSFRWARLLMTLLEEEKVDTGMITFLSCPLVDIKDILQSCREQTGNLYSTCSRELAQAIKADYPNTVSSTGGPNTLVTSDWSNPAVRDAIRMSATIESSGQCTALRHVVAPIGTTEQDVAELLSDSTNISSADEALRQGAFDGVFAGHKGSQPGPSAEEGYKRHTKADASYRVLKDSLPPNGIEEYWRRVVVDVSAINVKDQFDELVDWLNANQPISLGINGETREESLDLGFRLWERTGLVVNTIGSPENPALTCQARPQEGEIFGEFPPRRFLNQHTKFPVVVPSSTPSYDASYTNEYLEQQGKMQAGGKVGSFLQDLSDSKIKGYCILLYQYLLDATIQNPKRGYGSSRTAVYGLQRPPLGTTTYLNCNSSVDDLAPFLFLFFATNADSQVAVVSENADIKDFCDRHGITTLSSMEESSLKSGNNFVDITTPFTTFSMVGNFITTLFPVGHIKSTTPGDEEFIARVSNLEKWLRIF
mmetsp:Transcript_19983/g.49720  ORF Transcript_19983/g.49720 Transcript_19983/m.49720 type:complete len:727 (+) Transcript_19983:44-2224(+)